MKRIALFSLLCLAPAVFAGETKTAATFQGEMERTITTQEGSATAHYSIKERKAMINIETKDGRQGLLVDMAARQITKLMPDKKAYLTIELPDLPKTVDVKNSQLKRTGKTQVILGKTCEEWVYKNPKAKVTLWAVPGMGDFMVMTNEVRPTETWMGAIKAKNLFPMKVVNQDAAGKTAFTMEVTKIEEKALEDNLFEIPKDYKKMDLSTLLQQSQPVEK